MPNSIPTLVLLLAVTPVSAEIAAVDTPAGPARVEGAPFEGGERLMVGDRVAVAEADYPYVWIEAQAGTLLLVGLGSGGTACPAFFAWVHTEAADLTRTEAFGTCSDLAQVTSDAETVTVTMPSFDAAEGDVAYLYDGRGPVREVAVGQRPSGAEGTADWIGRHPADLFRSSDWRGPLVALMGEEAYAEAQAVIEIGEPMAASGGWVSGGGCMAHACQETAGAVAISVADGRLLVALTGAHGAPRLWGDPRGPLPRPLAEVMGGG